ncbi:FecR family protein [Pseudomonas brassicacearum]|uniref:Peptide ABC transporter substrate-binding protein n=1 Tax=Pseudomonas brassicacearum TaxID=930166 RepID=A0A423GJP3_9PSED|nr:FecR family protein [Pseudomonas brassicacearum]ROM90564.1 peptide ABC transporter substrate-binding protein [Pseudomonas brassicacearum]
MSEDTLSEAEYDAVTDAAAHWCMRLHATDCTAAERQAFEQWRDAHPLHAFEYEAMLEIWDVSEHLPRTENLAPVSPPKFRSSWRAWGMAAAISAFALPLAAYTGWELGWLPNAYERFEAEGALRHVTLSDGSQVELNLGTVLTYSNYKDQRRVTLKKGEAFFRVSHDRQHPFVVKAAEGQIRVTGTQFNVWKYQDQVRVTLVEGSVLVTSNDTLRGDGLRLEPGMQARYKGGDYQPRISQADANDASLAWREGKLVLDNLSLNEALPLINRYLSNPVMLADTATGMLRVGGIYNISELKTLVLSLPQVLPVYLSQNTDGNPVINSLLQQPLKR